MRCKQASVPHDSCRTREPVTHPEGVSPTATDNMANTTCAKMAGGTPDSGTASPSLSGSASSRSRMVVLIRATRAGTLISTAPCSRIVQPFALARAQTSWFVPYLPVSSVTTYEQVIPNRGTQLLRAKTNQSSRWRPHLLGQRPPPEADQGHPSFAESWKMTIVRNNGRA